MCVCGESTEQNVKPVATQFLHRYTFDAIFSHALKAIFSHFNSI